MYKNENDNELLYLISENNEDAKDVFYEKYKEIIEIKAKKYASFLNSKGYELGDLVQEGMIGLSHRESVMWSATNVRLQNHMIAAGISSPS